VVVHNPDFIILRERNAGTNYTSFLRLNATSGEVIQAFKDPTRPAKGSWTNNRVGDGIQQFKNTLFFESE